VSVALHLWLLAAALAIDFVVGDPAALWRRVPHPVAIIGWVIGGSDTVLNRSSLPFWLRRALGIVVVLFIVAAAVTGGIYLERWLAGLRWGWVAGLIIATVLLAARSLYDHVAAVAAALDEGIDAARVAVARIVGRDPASLDEPRIARAAIESLAENFSDGVVAPAFWFAVLGLPGLLAYKAINTADSMIGHLDARHEAFGWAAARLDDLLNLPASRLSGLLIALAAPFGGGRTGASLRVMVADAGKHRSPNAGWPEAAMAAALGLALAGPRRYAGVIVADPFVNERGRLDAVSADIWQALRIYVGANAALLAIVVIAGSLAVLR
jgi:adenosylcobinamide-phosphate synthase